MLKYKFNEKKARELLGKGFSYEKVAKKLGFKHKSVLWYRLNRKEKLTTTQKLKIAIEALEYYESGEDIEETRNKHYNRIYVVDEGYGATAEQALEKIRGEK